MIWRWLYSLLFYLLTPLLLLYLWRRGARQPAYRSGWAQRFGYYREGIRQPVIWLHAVSVGETRAAAPLVEALLARYPQHRILLTQMTPTGRETAQALFGERVSVAYLPYDQPAAVARFFRHFRPALGVLLETELWPNLLHGAAAAGVPLFLLNARLSEKSLRGYLRLQALIAPALRRLHLIAAQHADDAARLAQLAQVPLASIAVMGNMKFDFSLPVAAIEQGKRWRTALARARPVLVAGCTREGEELLLLNALGELPETVLLVLVPRHPQRFDDVAGLLAERHIPCLRRSAWDETSPAPGLRVLLGDSLGELAAYYAMGDVAFVGGSLVNLGSHSLIEPCAQGVPVLIGPSTFNFADAVREALAAGAARQVESAQAMYREAERLLAATDERIGMAEAGVHFVGQHRGAVARAMAMLALRLPA